jgi:hypothetical protein
MRGVLSVGALTLLLAPGNAAAQAANDRSLMWICRSSEGYSCQQGSGCKFIPAELLKTVDFKNMVVKDFGSDHASKITNIRFFESRFSPSATYFVAGMSQSFVILADAKKEIAAPNVYPFRVSAVSAEPGQNVYFGTCSPQG